MVGGLQNKKIAFVIQARMQSSRLPGKVLLPLPIGSNTSTLERLIKTLDSSKHATDTIVATSINKENNVLAEFCDKHEIKCFRGSENDVLSRFISISENNNYDCIVRLTADNPIVDIKSLDDVIQLHLDTKNDYTNTQGLPLGMNFEIVNSDALKSIKHEKLTNLDREHVTLFFKNSVKYKIDTIHLFQSKDYEKIRATIDYPTDYLVISSIFSILENNQLTNGIELIDFTLSNYNWLFDINLTNHQKRSYGNLKAELKDAIPVLKKYEFMKTVNLLNKIE